MNERLKKQKEASRAGRRNAILFDNDWQQDFFLRVTRILLDKYYDHSPDNTKKNIVFSEKRRMGKTQFWACIHLICRKRGILNNDKSNHNLEPFVEFLHETFGIEMVGERTVISKKEKQLLERNANTLLPLDMFKRNEQPDIEKSRKAYQCVLRYWEETEKEVMNSSEEEDGQRVFQTK